jgi:hypothetical protein
MSYFSILLQNLWLSEKKPLFSYHLNCFHTKNLKQLLSNKLAIKLKQMNIWQKKLNPWGIDLSGDISQKEEISLNCRVTHISDKGVHFCTRYTTIGCCIGFHHISITKYAIVLWTHSTWWFSRCPKGHYLLHLHNCIYYYYDTLCYMS